MPGEHRSGAWKEGSYEGTGDRSRRAADASLGGYQSERYGSEAWQGGMQMFEQYSNPNGTRTNIANEAVVLVKRYGGFDQVPHGAKDKFAEKHFGEVHSDLVDGFFYAAANAIN